MTSTNLQRIVRYFVSSSHGQPVISVSETRRTWDDDLEATAKSQVLLWQYGGWPGHFEHNPAIWSSKVASNPDRQTLGFAVASATLWVR